MHRLDKILRTCENPGRGPIHWRAALADTGSDAVTGRLEPALSVADTARAPVAVPVRAAAVAVPSLGAPGSRADRTW